MALSLEQRTEIIGMIAYAQEEVHAFTMGEVTTGLGEIRMDTDLFYTKQTKMNEEFEVKFGKLSAEVEEKFGKFTATVDAKFTELRLELGTHFAAMQANTTEMQTMMDALEARKTTMAGEIKETFETRREGLGDEDAD